MNGPDLGPNRPPFVRFGTSRLLVLAACLAAGPPPNAEEVRDEMAGHWQASVAARDAVVAGDLGAARAHASTWGAQTPPPSDTLKDAKALLDPPFARLALSTTLGEAGEALGQVANACGDCHVQSNATRSFEPPAPPRSASAMSHHQSAAEAMWAGLVGPSDVLFASGAATLASVNFAPSGMPTGGAVQRQALAFEVDVQDLAGRAARSRRAAQRSRLYGQMLGKCGGCHVLTQGGPQAAGAVSPPLDSPMTSEMHTRFAVLTQARNAVRDGHLDKAKSYGENLLSIPPPTGLPASPWRPYLVEVSSRAEALSRAATLDDASLAVARIAVSCGGCHEAVGGGPAVPREDEVEVVSSSGMDLLWLGLISASDETWMMGAEMLNDKALSYKSPGEARAKAFAERLR